MILVSEDNKILREGICQALREKKLDVMEADNGKTAMELIDSHSFSLIISDIKLPEASGMDILRYVKEESSETVVILITAYGTIDVAVEAMKLGAFDFIQKPFSIEELELKTDRALAHRDMINKIDYLSHEQKYIYRYDDVIGNSPQLKDVFSTISKVARTSVTILINGETGTGKELIAGAVHYNSNRKKKNFIKVNCAAIPDDLLESELFGHERGAFTGADKVRIGRFEQADGGSIFLDEIADMSPKTQAKVLRVLQEQEFERLGGTKSIKVDVRILAASNKNLKEMVLANEFREDLYYRLNVVCISVPPLRERGDDVISLAEYFLKKYKREFQKKISGFSDEALFLLRSYRWPGNIRELKNSIERASLMTGGVLIGPEDLGLQDKPNKEQPAIVYSDKFDIPSGGVSLQEIEKSLVIKALEKSNWVQKDAAKLLGLSRRVIHYKIENYGIKNDKWIKNK